MSDVDVTLGPEFDRLLKAVQKLPEAATARFQAVAAATASRVLVRARQILGEKTHGHGDTARAIGIIEDTRNKQYIVQSQAPLGKPSNLPTWLEYGTAHAEPKSYMRPALYGEDANYKRDMAAAAQDVLSTLE